MRDLDIALAAIRREDDPSRKNLRVAEVVADYRVGDELRAILAQESGKGREAR